MKSEEGQVKGTGEGLGIMKDMGESEVVKVMRECGGILFCKTVSRFSLDSTVEFLNEKLIGV